MIPIAAYSVKMAVILGVFVLVYVIVLKRFNFFKSLRFFFLVSLTIAVVFPLVTINIENVPAKNVWPYKTLHQFKNNFNEKLKEFNPENSEPTKHSNLTLSKKQMSTKTTDTNTIQKALIIAFWVYVAGCFLYFIKLLAGAITIINMARNSTKEKHNQKTINWVQKNIPPMSFFNLIILPEKLKNSNDFNNVLTHEIMHIKRKHSIDIMLVELVTIFQWINPVLWVFKKYMKNNLEFQADKDSINSGLPKTSYQLSLLNLFIGRANFIAITPYSMNGIKDRLKKMDSKKTSAFAQIFLAIPLTFSIILFTIFCLETNFTTIKNFKKEIAQISQQIFSATPKNISEKETNRAINTSIKTEKQTGRTNNDALLSGINFENLTMKNGIAYVADDTIPYTGECYKLHTSGEIGMKGYFVNGEECGKWTYYYSNGNKKMECNISNGTKNGICQLWYKSGQKMMEAQFDQGELIHNYSFWHPNGQIKKITCYENGVPLESETFNEKGIPVALL